MSDSTKDEWNEESLRMPLDGTQFIESTPGISLRDMFAGLAMHAVLTALPQMENTSIARQAVDMADDLIAELEREIRNE